MTSDPESKLFDFAASKRVPTNEEEKTVTELHAALGTTGVPLRLRRPPVLVSRPIWRRYVYAAVTVALVVAVATAGFLAVQQQSSTPPPTEVPEVVLGLASPDSDDAILATDASCDFSGDTPYFSGLDTSPVDGPALLLTPDEDLVKVCGSETSTLLSGVKVGGPTHTPHVMMAITENANHLINIVTEEQIEVPNSGPEAQTSISEMPFGPWILSASTSDMTMASVYDLASMNEVPIISENEEAIEIAGLENAVVSSGKNQIAIAIPDDPDSINSSLTGFFITAVTGESRFVAVEHLAMPRQIAMSPDGQTIATSSFDGSFSGGTTTITLLSTEDGEVTQSWELNTRDQASELAWLRDSSMLMLTDGTKLLGITPDSQREGIHVFVNADIMQGLTLTPDDHVVAISQSTTSGNSTNTETLFVNIDTNSIVTQPGSDPWISPNISATRTTLVLNRAQMARAGDKPNLLVVDAATGDVLGEIDQDLSIENGFQSSTWGYGEGDIVTVAFGPDSMWRLVDESGNATLEKISPPPLEETEYQAVSLTITPDGSMTLRTFEPNSLWLRLAGDDGWTQIETTTPEDSPGIHPSVSFVIGKAEASQSPETATPAPDGTPIASPVTAAACDFEKDTPLIMGAESAPTGDAAILITPSGEMNLVCGESETTLATNVDFAFPMNAPNVLLAETSEGAMLLNIATGETLELPYSAMTVLQNQHLVSPWGSWMVVPSSDDQTLASIVDLRTLTEIPITVSVDHRVQENAIAAFSVNTSDTHAVVAVSFDHSSSSRYLQGFFIVDAEGEHRFIHTQSDVLPRTITISPDGQTIATSWYQGTMESGETNISLYDANDGELIHSWDVRTGDIQTELTWLSDGSGVVFTDGTALYKIDPMHPGDGLQVLLEGQEVSGILLTPDPNVVAASITKQQQQGPPASQTAIVNTETGETLLLEGRDLWASSFGPTPTRSVLVLLDFFAWHAEDSLTLTVVDSVTGEKFGEIEHNPAGQMSISNATSQRNQGDVDIFSLSADTTWQLLDENDQPHLQQISPPDGRSEVSGSDLLVAMNRDGQVVMTFFDPFEVWLWQPDTDEWTKLDVTAPDNDLGLPIVVMFIPGDD